VKVLSLPPDILISDGEGQGHKIFFNLTFQDMEPRGATPSASVSLAELLRSKDLKPLRT
jgi:hypothetical protein